MKPERWQLVKEILEETLDANEDRREALIADRCGDDLELRREVEALLVADQRAGGVLTPLKVAEGPVLPRGEVIGPYRIVSLVGQGGMGEVYEAEQSRPIRRRVALKLVKLGMDTRQVIARFDTERQALALMSHANIARVFDVGATEKGRPYFVMEYVPGVPVSDYCDANHLGTEERLRLFIQICEGVHHAHQKGVIHRDLKPSNVLVTLVDGKPVVKIIDFGVAKATAQRLTEATFYTELGQAIGTPEYMSPEQTEVTGIDVDTRTDVYALGILLYELLTGARPFDFGSRGVSFDEIQRRIREEEPTRPSTRARELSRTSPEVAKNRRTDPGTLVSALRGDLDWITLKALEKDRARRYASVPELAADIERHLSHQPVLAGPSSATYRIGKFARRHRVGVAVMSLVLGLLVAFGAAMAVQSIRISRERDRANLEAAKARAVNEFIRETLAAADPFEGEGRDVTVTQALGNAVEKLEHSLSGEPEVRAAIEATIGSTYQGLGRFDEAEPLLVSALETRRELFDGPHPDVAESLRELAALRYGQGRYTESESVYREALQMHRVLPGREREVRRDLQGLAVALYAQQEFAEAERLHREVLRLCEEEGSDPTPELSRAIAALALTMDTMGEFEQAEALYRRALAMDRELYGDEHPRTAATISNLGQLLSDAKGPLAAEPYYREALAIRRQVLGAHPDTAWSLLLMGGALSSRGDAAGAERFYREALEMQREVLGEEHPELGSTLGNLASELEKAGRLDEAEDLYREAIEINRGQPGGRLAAIGHHLGNLSRIQARRGNLAEAESLRKESCALTDQALGTSHWRSARCRSHYGALLTEGGRYAEAEGLLIESHRFLQEDLGPEHRFTKMTGDRLVALYEAWGQPDKAAQYRALLPDGASAEKETASRQPEE